MTILGLGAMVEVSNDGGNFVSTSANLPADPTGFNSIGEIISKLLPYVYVVAGLALLLMLVLGGIGLMTSAGNPDKIKSASGRIKVALIGFLIIFISYFVALIVEKILGVSFM